MKSQNQPQLLNDRNYFRMLSDSALVDHVDRMLAPSELELVLADRLSRRKRYDWRY